MMPIDGKIRDDKQQYDINIQTAKMLELSSNISDKYEYLAGKKVLPLY